MKPTVPKLTPAEFAAVKKEYEEADWREEIAKKGLATEFGLFRINVEGLVNRAGFHTSSCRCTDRFELPTILAKGTVVEIHPGDLIPPADAFEHLPEEDFR